jgi:RNAse (barnase) inhibitor barstar
MALAQAGAAHRARCESGVYTIDDEQRIGLLRGDLAPAGLQVAVVDGQVAVDRNGIFDELARTMCFPDYFGRNWDAVYDCLTDPSLLPVDGSVIFLDGCDRLSDDHPDQWQIALKVFGEACTFWRPTQTPMFILLHGAATTSAGAPELPSGCLLRQRPNRKARAPD